jgi:hypothetical protein
MNERAGLTASPPECYILKLPGDGASGLTPRSNEFTGKQGSWQGKALER